MTSRMYRGIDQACPSARDRAEVGIIVTLNITYPSARLYELRRVHLDTVPQPSLRQTAGGAPGAVYAS